MANIAGFNSDVFYNFHNLQLVHIHDYGMRLVDADNEVMLSQSAYAVYFDVLRVEPCLDGDLTETSVQFHLARG